MRLMLAHKVLISAALCLCVILLVRGVRLYAHGGTTGDLAFGLIFGGVGVAVAFYLRFIWPK
jgi:hypothetical protein